MIKETIIVEGRDDITAVKAAVDAHVIATGGTHFGDRKLEEIRQAAARTGIIVLTDPDYAGLKIRDRITRAVPDAKHAYLPRKRAEVGGRAGIEYASKEDIRHALKNLKTQGAPSDRFTTLDLMRLKLTGSKDAAARRSRVADSLHIGDCNARQFVHRLNRYGITEEQLLRAMEETDGE